VQDQFISPDAQIGIGNKFGRGVIIDAGVTLGDNNVIRNYAVLTGRTQIGNGNHIGSHVTIGEIPTHTRGKFEFVEQDASGSTGLIHIGNGNVIREYSEVGMPTGSVTEIRNNCYISTHCHIPHDSSFEDGLIMANHSSPGGHNRIMEGANFGKFVQSHPRVVIGPFTMLGIGAVVIHNVLPGSTAFGNPARVHGVNRIGLERNGFSESEIRDFADIIETPRNELPDPNAYSTKVADVLRRFMDALANARDSRLLGHA
jgi:UDP-N-acetylglucosamine acyltransferase